jgi:translation elongation factor EF-Ts
MSEDEFPYLKVRAVRDETGASHEECREALRQSGGDVDAAVSLWFARRREASARPSSGSASNAGQDQSQPTRSQ